MAGSRNNSHVDLSSLGRGATGGIWDASPAEMERFRPRSSYNVSTCKGHVVDRLKAEIVPHQTRNNLSVCRGASIKPALYPTSANHYTLQSGTEAAIQDVH